MVKKQKLIGDIIRINAHIGGYNCPGEEWRSSKSISGGILYDMGAHILEYCFQLIDSPVTEVSGFTHTGFWADQSKWKNDTNEDDANIVVRFKSGQWITMNCSSIDSYPGNKDRGWMEITGTKGTYIIDPGAWKLITKQEIKTGPELPGNWGDYYKNLANHLVNGEPLVITAELGRKIIHIIDMGYQSAKKGRTLKPVHK